MDFLNSEGQAEFNMKNSLPNVEHIAIRDNSFPLKFHSINLCYVV